MTAPWSFLVIPDTQKLATPASNLSGYYNGMRDWVLANVDTYNVQFVGGLGDIINNYGDEPSWEVAETALLPLLDLDIPVMLLASGNHDTDTSNQRTRSLTGYNSHFGVDLYSGKPWYGGVYETGSAQNMWGSFTVGSHDYLAFMLEFYPRAGVLDWMESVTAAHPDHRVLVVTHSYLHPSGTRDTWTSGQFGPADYFEQDVDDANSGDQMWQGWLKTVPNLLGVFNGHYYPGNVSYRVDQGDAGNRVLQGFYNWQQALNGGMGRVILFTVDEDAGTIHQQVVRPDLDGFETGTSNGFAYDTTHTIWVADDEPPPPVDLPPGYYVVSDGVSLHAVDVGAGQRVVQVT